MLYSHKKRQNFYHKRKDDTFHSLSIRLFTCLKNYTWLKTKPIEKLDCTSVLYKITPAYMCTWIT